MYGKHQVGLQTQLVIAEGQVPMAADMLLSTFKILGSSLSGIHLYLDYLCNDSSDVMPLLYLVTYFKFQKSSWKRKLSTFFEAMGKKGVILFLNH